MKISYSSSNRSSHASQQAHSRLFTRDNKTAEDIRKMLHDLYGDYKTDSEASFIHALTEQGKISNAYVLFLAFACFWCCFSVNVQKHMFISTECHVRTRCFIKEIEYENFTYEQRLNISLISLSPNPNSQYCYYEVNNYVRLLKQNEYNYTRIMSNVNITRRMNTEPKFKNCTVLVKDFKRYKFGKTVHFRDIEWDYNLFCVDAVWKTRLRLVFSYGSLFGAIPFGIIGDICGRKTVFNISTLIVLFSFVFIHLPCFSSILVGRFLSGVANDNVLFSLYIILTENCNKHSRQYFGYLIFTGFSFSLIYEHIVYENFVGWKSSFIASNLTYTIQLFLIWFVKESPRWLYFTKHKRQAIEMSDRNSTVTGGENSSRLKSLKSHCALFNLPHFRSRIFLNFILFFLNSSLIYVDWKLVNDYGITRNLYDLLSGIGSVIITFAVTGFLFYFKKRICLFVMYGIVTLFNLVLFFYGESFREVMLMFSVTARGLSVGCLFLMYHHIMELYPTTHRFTALGIAVTGRGLARLVYSYTMEILHNSPSLFEFAPSFACSVICSLFVLFVHESSGEIPDKPREALRV